MPWIGAAAAAATPTRDGWVLVEWASQPDFDDTTDADSILAVFRWGVSAGDPYFNSAGVTAGDEAALFIRPPEGTETDWQYVLVPLADI